LVEKFGLEFPTDVTLTSIYKNRTDNGKSATVLAEHVGHHEMKIGFRAKQT
jgi:hypothetical protein